SVRALKEGAIDFLTKPVDETQLFKAIEEAAVRWREASKARREWRIIQARLATLTPRERQVLEQVVSGDPNKQIADRLGTVEKTVKVHRARVMQKMGARTFAELILIAARAGIGRMPPPGGTSWAPRLSPD